MSASDLFVGAVVSGGAGVCFKLWEWSTGSNINDLRSAKKHIIGSVPEQRYMYVRTSLVSEHPQTYKDGNGMLFEMAGIQQIERDMVDVKRTEVGTDNKSREYNYTEARTTTSQGRQMFEPIKLGTQNFLDTTHIIDPSFFGHIPFTKVFSSMKAPGSQPTNVNVNVGANTNTGNTTTKAPIGIEKTIYGVRNNAIFTIVGNFDVEDSKVIVTPAEGKYTCITPTTYSALLHDLDCNAMTASLLGNGLIAIGLMFGAGGMHRQRSNL